MIPLIPNLLGVTQWISLPPVAQATRSASLLPQGASWAL